MPGQPFELETELVIEKEHGGVDALYQRLAAGENLSAIARTITVKDPRTGVLRSPDRATVRRVLNNSDERRVRYADARKESAEADVDAAREKLETAPETREGIAKAREVAAHLRWEATKKDRDQFGDDNAGASVLINAPGQLFLQAVSRPGALRQPPRSADAVDAHTDQSAPDTSRLKMRLIKPPEKELE
jgi:terminase small subunit-like protein